jgi:predicted transcriptional regulator
MSVEQVAESLGSTPLAVHRAYLILVPARRGQVRSKKPSQIEELLATSKEQMKTLERLGRSHEQIGDFLGTSQSVVSAALAVLRQRDEAVRRLSEGGSDGLARLQDEELRIRRESGFGLAVQEVIDVAGSEILRRYGGGTPLRQVALELRLCRETVRKAYQEMTKARFENELTQYEMGEAA